MKAFLLAAGRGTRLWPYTASTPKCLLPIQGVPILEIWLELCRQYGISDVLVNTHSHATAVFEFVRQWRNGICVTVVEEPELFGSAGTLRANRSWIGADDKFWVFYADVLTSINLETMLQFHSSHTAATLGVYLVPDPERCGIVSFEADHTVTEFAEKPLVPKSQWAFAGIMIATPELLDAIPGRSGADIAFDVLPRLIHRMRAYPISEFVMDIGTVPNYELAQRSWPGFAKRHTG